MGSVHVHLKVTVIVSALPVLEIHWLCRHTSFHVYLSASTEMNRIYIQNQVDNSFRCRCQSRNTMINQISDIQITATAVLQCGIVELSILLFLHRTEWYVRSSLVLFPFLIIYMIVVFEIKLLCFPLKRAPGNSYRKSCRKHSNRNIYIVIFHGRKFERWAQLDCCEV
jgi:hypothetical protein